MAHALCMLDNKSYRQSLAERWALREGFFSGEPENEVFERYSKFPVNGPLSQ